MEADLIVLVAPLNLSIIPKEHYLHIHLHLGWFYGASLIITTYEHHYDNSPMQEAKSTLVVKLVVSAATIIVWPAENVHSAYIKVVIIKIKPNRYNIWLYGCILLVLLLLLMMVQTVVLLLFLQASVT